MDYATQLRKAFKEAYPEEDVGSAVLLQTFLSGLRPSIARQVMLKGRPTALDKAIEEAVTVEEALRFGGADTMEVPVHAVHPKETTTEVEQLRHMLERMSKKFESFEQQLKELDAGRATDNNSVERERCHRKRECLLNFNVAVRKKTVEAGEGTLVSYAERKVIGKGSVLLTSTGQHRRWTGAGAKGSSPPNIQASQQVTCTITSLRIQY